MHMPQSVSFDAQSHLPKMGAVAPLRQLHHLQRTISMGGQLVAHQKTKSFKADFFLVTVDENRNQTDVIELLSAEDGYTEAKAHPADEDERYQVRSIVALPRERGFKAAFGRAKHNEKPVQGTDDGHEEEVELKPGHGLIQKNYFIYYSKRNLLVYQRNSNGSHHSQFQRYLGQVLGKRINFEPILTADNYRKLLANESPTRKIELSFQKPRDPSLYKGLWMGDAIQLVDDVDGISAYIKISVGRTSGSLLGQIKKTAVHAARTGLAKVARIQLADAEEPIDLIADRIVATITVPIDKNGRPDVESIYAELDSAVTERRADLKAFFGG